MAADMVEDPAGGSAAPGESRETAGPAPGAGEGQSGVPHAQARARLQDIIDDLLPRAGDSVTDLEAALREAIAAAGLAEQPASWIGNMATEVSAGRSVVLDARTAPAALAATLSGQHRHLRGLAVEVLHAGEDSAAAGAAFARFGAFLSAHESVEQVFMHGAGEEAGVETDSRLQEEAAVGEAMTRLESLPAGGPDFREGFADLADAMLRHAEAEEHAELPRVAAALSLERVSAAHRALLQVPGLARDHEASDEPFEERVASERGRFEGATS